MFWNEYLRILNSSKHPERLGSVPGKAERIQPDPERLLE
jgi:hypothetical protein